MRVAISLAVLFCCCVALRAAEPPANLPEGFELVYSETFDSAESLNGFQFSDPQAWRWNEAGKSGGALELHRQSQYKTAHRSPFNLGMISNREFSDFVLEADMKQTGREYGHRDMCLFFDFQGPTRFYYTHLATHPDPNAHNIFIVNDAPRKSFAPISEQGIDWGSDWQHVRLERVAGNIRVFFNDLSAPVFEAEEKTFQQGAIGFGSFDDTGMVDNLQIWSNGMRQQEKTLFPK